VKPGTRGGLLDLAVFLAIFVALLALYDRGFPDLTGLLWLGVVLLASVYLVWKVMMARRAKRANQLRGGWGAVVPEKLWRWMIGEDDAKTRDD
jgi:hypothetical protein